MSDTTFIYALRDPNTKEIKYIGKTNNPRTRLSGHKMAGVNQRLSDWIRSLQEQGQQPVMQILEECPRKNHRKAELSWLFLFLDCGFELFNAVYPGMDWRKMRRDSGHPYLGRTT